MSTAPPPAASELAATSQFLARLRTELERVIVGQPQLVEGLLIGLVADGHVLLEGLPGLAKTLAVESLARAIGGRFSRVQFTPDLLPADLVGTQVFHPGTGEWSVREGPVFANFLLADEINRAPAKVQSALLEAMQERQVSLAGETRSLPEPFPVLATQNPVDQDGTYALPEAQVDRFMLKVVVHYPDRDAEREIVERMARPSQRPVIQQVGTPEAVLDARRVLESVRVEPQALDYILDLVRATRAPGSVGLDAMAPLIELGASPRASIAWSQAARARALFEGRDYVTPLDIKAVGYEILRHRVVLSYEAEAQDVRSEDLLQQLFDHVPVP